MEEIRATGASTMLTSCPKCVGKTESAVQLAQMLSGSANNLIRVDCNTLQPTGHQKTSVIWTLLGVPPGYMGHGEGGLLSKVREKPNRYARNENGHGWGCCCIHSL